MNPSMMPEGGNKIENDLVQGLAACSLDDLLAQAGAAGEPGHAVAAGLEAVATASSGMQPLAPSQIEAGDTGARNKQVLQQLIHILRSPQSPEQQQRVLTLLKSNPPLMAALIKHRMQQQQQQQHQQGHVPMQAMLGGQQTAGQLGPGQPLTSQQQPQATAMLPTPTTDPSLAFQRQQGQQQQAQHGAGQFEQPPYQHEDEE